MAAKNWSLNNIKIIITSTNYSGACLYRSLLGRNFLALINRQMAALERRASV